MPAPIMLSFGDQGKIISLFDQCLGHTDRLNKALLLFLAGAAGDSSQNRDAVNGRNLAHFFRACTAIAVITQLALLLHIHKITVNSGKRNAGSFDDFSHAGDFIVFVIKRVDEICDDRLLRFVFPSHMASSKAEQTVSVIRIYHSKQPVSIPI